MSIYFNSIYGSDEHGNGSFNNPYKTATYSVQQAPDNTRIDIIMITNPENIQDDDPYVDLIIFNNKIITFYTALEEQMSFEGVTDKQYPIPLFINVYNNQSDYHNFNLTVVADIIFYYFGRTSVLVLPSTCRITTEKGIWNHFRNGNKNISQTVDTPDVTWDINGTISCNTMTIDTLMTVFKINISGTLVCKSLDVNHVQQDKSIFSVTKTGYMEINNLNLVTTGEHELIHVENESKLNIKNGGVNITCIKSNNTNNINNTTPSIFNVVSVYDTDKLLTENPVKLSQTIWDFKNETQSNVKCYLFNLPNFTISHETCLNNISLYQSEKNSIYSTLYNKNGHMANGNLNYGFIDITNDYYHTTRDGKYFFINAINNDITIILPNDDNQDGRKISYIRIDDSKHKVKIESPSGYFINNSKFLNFNNTCSVKYPSITLIQHKHNWFLNP